MDTADNPTKFQYTTLGFSLGLGLQSTGVPAAGAVQHRLGSSRVVLATTPVGQSSQESKFSKVGLPNGTAPQAQQVQPEAEPNEAEQPESKAPALQNTIEFLPVEVAPQPAPEKSSQAQEEAKQLEELGKRPYWMRHISRIRSPLLRLHEEVMELCEMLQPTDEEAEARKAAVDIISAEIKAIWSSATIAVFGSFSTGLYIPTSDIDLVVLNSGHSDTVRSLRTLATTLETKGLVRNVNVIAKARVPIIKFETVEYGGLSFDISFDVANGPQAAELVKERTRDWPVMKHLILVLKLFLQQRELNEVYTGGIGSYALINMVTAFLQLHESRLGYPNTTASALAAAKKARNIDPSLGMLLVDFFRFYGRIINLTNVGLSCNGGGRYFTKADKDGDGLNDWRNPDRPYLLSIEDPKDPTNDIARGSYWIMRVKTAFEYAYQQLIAPSKPDQSMLARILRLGPVLASRRPSSRETLVKHGFYTRSTTAQEGTQSLSPSAASRQQASKSPSASGKLAHKTAAQRVADELLADAEVAAGGRRKRKHHIADLDDAAHPSKQRKRKHAQVVDESGTDMDMSDSEQQERKQRKRNRSGSADVPAQQHKYSKSPVGHHQASRDGHGHQHSTAHHNDHHRHHHTSQHHHQQHHHTTAHPRHHHHHSSHHHHQQYGNQDNYQHQQPHQHQLRAPYIAPVGNFTMGHYDAQPPPRHGAQRHQARNDRHRQQHQNQQQNRQSRHVRFPG